MKILSVWDSGEYLSFSTWYCTSRVSYLHCLEISPGNTWCRYCLLLLVSLGTRCLSMFPYLSSNCRDRVEFVFGCRLIVVCATQKPGGHQNRSTSGQFFAIVGMLPFLLPTGRRGPTPLSSSEFWIWHAISVDSTSGTKYFINTSTYYI